MTEVVSVKFKNRGKSYYFDPNGLTVEDGAAVIVETSKGLEIAETFKGNHYVADDSVVQPLRPIVRLATPNDLRVAEINKRREKEAFTICQKKIAEHGLDMKLVDVECSFEGNKTTFFFTSDGRVDFRELVKDLASVFRNRIELRQIGVRDEAKMLGGLGICGRPFCCSQFLDEFQPVSTKMAKMQSMSLNPAKISGTCGRLMCCLRYEEEAYEDLTRSVPKSGAFVETPAGYGVVTQINLLRRIVKIRLDGEGEDVYKSYSADDIAVIPGGRPKPGEPYPHILKPRPAVVEAPEEAPAWPVPAAPTALVRTEPDTARDSASQQKKQNNRRRGGGKPQQKAPQQPQEKKGEAKVHPRPAGPKPNNAQRDQMPRESRDPSAAPRRGSRNNRGRRPGGKPGAPSGE